MILLIRFEAAGISSLNFIVVTIERRIKAVEVVSGFLDDPQLAA